jgi:hypothetical protein
MRPCRSVWAIRPWTRLLERGFSYALVWPRRPAWVARELGLREIERAVI